MNLQDDPGAVFRNTMPETTPPPAQFDLDRIVRDGYRARRRQRAVIGGAGSAGVAAVAAVLALSIGIVPNRDDGTNGPPAADRSTSTRPWPATRRTPRLPSPGSITR